MLFVLTTIGILLCAVMAIRAQRLLTSALWLAGTSALLALLIFMLGAAEIAVIELSVGAGLVTVLFVFAINIAGEDTRPVRSLIPRPLALALICVAGFLAAWLFLPAIKPALPESGVSPFAFIVWRDRSVDVLLQAALIFTGVLGLLGLLAEGSQPTGTQSRPQAGKDHPL